MKKKTFIFLIFYIVFVLPLSLYAGRVVLLENGAADIERFYIDYNPDILNLSTTTGSIHIISDDSFFVEVEKFINGIDCDSALYLLDYLSVDKEEEEQALSFTFDGPSTGFPEEGIKYMLNYICHVPPYTNINTEILYGNIDIYNIFGSVSINLLSGNIKMAGGQGSIFVDFDNGNLDIRWSLKTGSNIEIAAENGNISLMLPQSSSFTAEFGAETGVVSYHGFDDNLKEVSHEGNIYNIVVGGGKSIVNVFLNQGNVLIQGY